MTDTQWGRFIVFHQETENKPHTYAGSVHAPDSDLALLNARDVFVRRPKCVSLWIVSERDVFSCTAEELVSIAKRHEMSSASDATSEIYTLIQKSAHKGSYIYKGEVSASTPEHALTTAFKTIAARKALAWWVIPSRKIRRSTAEDIESLFQPAITKDYRDQANFHTVTALQSIKTHSQDTLDEA